MLRRPAALALFLAFAVNPALAQDDKVVLTYKFEADKPLLYLMDMNTTANFATPDGGVRKTSMVSHMELKQELIEKKADGNFRISVTIVKATQTVDNQPAQLPIEPGHTILMEMKPNGEVVTAEGDLPAPQGQSQIQMVFPSEGVTKGLEWERTTDITEPLPMKAVTDYVVKDLAAELPSYQGKVALIESKMDMQNEKDAQGGGVSSKTNGQIWFDAAAGRIVQSKATSQFKMTIPIALENVLKPGSMVDIDFNIDVSITLKQ